MKCNICKNDCFHQFSETLLNKYLCAYFYCAHCGFLQTEEPYWLNEAYQNAIAAADTGLVHRNVYLSKVTSALLFFLFDTQGKYLDVAGGYGMLARLMRDIGFDYYWSDPYCQNLLCRGFEATTTSAPFAVITAFEVLEHVYNPLAFITTSLNMADCHTIIFSTELFEGSPPQPASWWYYSFETGQHISFYQRRTLETIGAKLGLNHYSNGSIHMFTDKRLNRVVYRFLTDPRISRILSLLPKYLMQSRMWSDRLDLLDKSF